MADLTVGIEAIDAQHTKLLTLVAEIAVQGRTPGPGARHEERLGALASKVQEHFTTEGSLMRKHLFTGVEPHEEAHRSFLATFAGLRQDLLAARESAPMTERFEALVGGWLELHIDGYDKVLARFLREKGER
ncbi:MAG: hemerythrin family protein [Deltaproteobacteria bacterium]|nr:hemerythrin family protein [Deltaproteobacteria bacterium]